MRDRAAPLLVVGLVGCGAAARGAAPDGRPAAPPASESIAATPRPRAELDTAAARRALEATDVTSCQSLPPLADEVLHARVVFEPAGLARSATVEPPFTGTPFGECVARLYAAARVPSFDGEARVVETSVARGPVRRDPTLGRFDARAVRALVQKVDLAECAEPPGARSAGPDETRGRVTVVVKPSGEAESITVEGAMSGTPRALCVERLLRRLEFRPYAGVLAPGVSVEFDVARRPGGSSGG